MKIIQCVLLALILVACNNKPTPTLGKLPADATILAFGDSLTYGTGATGGHDYPSVLAELTGLSVVNAGSSGEISSDGLARLPDLLDEQEPDLMILIHGGNDILRKIPPEQTAENLKRMIAAARERQIEVVMLGVPKPALFGMASAKIYGAIAESEQVATDLETLPEVLGDNKLKSDAAHPNDAGYALIAGRIKELLQSAGAL